MLHLAWKRGRYQPPDRRLYEEEILPRLEGDRILSVGVAWYTARHAEAFAGRRFVTMDIDPTRAEFGAKEHVTGDLCRLEEYFAEPFDVILLNGVIGYGLDDAVQVDRALRACAERLRTGGTLVLGINEEKPTNVDPSSVAAASLFEPRAFGSWTRGRVVVPVPFRERTHTFLFWRRV